MQQKAYRSMHKDVFYLRQQQRQDNTDSGRLLTGQQPCLLAARYLTPEMPRWWAT